MTDELDAIRQLCAAASPGPWRVEYERCDCGGDYPCDHGEYPYALRGPVRVDPLGDHAPSEVSEMLPADVEFVAAARTAMPALLAKIDGLTAVLCSIAFGHECASPKAMQERGECVCPICEARRALTEDTND